MESMTGFVFALLSLAAILLPIGIVAIVFWYKARERELELQESLRLREFEHLQRLKEMELEIERMKAQGTEKPVQT